jgi:hypothetical protein
LAQSFTAILIYNDVGQLVETKERPNRAIVSALLCCHEGQDASAFALAIMNKVKVKMIKAVTSRKGLLVVGPKLLAKCWKIGIEMARCTLVATTHTCIRTTLHLTLSRRFRTNDRALRYRRLSHDFYTDTMKAKSVLWFHQNKYVQVFCTRFGWTRIYPMRLKSEAHLVFSLMFQYAQVFCTRFGWTRIYPVRLKSEAHLGLSLMFQRDGVPPLIVMDGSKEQTMGQFCVKAREANCQIKQTVPYSPWQNAAESAIQEIKCAAGRKMAVSKCLQRILDH